MVYLSLHFYTQNSCSILLFFVVLFHSVLCMAEMMIDLIDLHDSTSLLTHCFAVSRSIHLVILQWTASGQLHAKALTPRVKRHVLANTVILECHEKVFKTCDTIVLNEMNDSVEYWLMIEFTDYWLGKCTDIHFWDNLLKIFLAMSHQAKNKLNEGPPAYPSKTHSFRQ